MHYLNPDVKAAHVAIFYRNFQAENSKKYNHVGLGNSGLHTTKVLRKNNIRTDLHGVWKPEQVDNILSENPSITHCILEAFWVGIEPLHQLLVKYPNVYFIVRGHSTMNFLVVEPGAITLMRQMLTLQDNVLNLTVSSNSMKLVDFIEKTYHSHCLYLPNLYDMERVYKKRYDSHNKKVLKIGSFGALRLFKGILSNLSGAMLIAEQLHTDLEFYVNVNREENSGAKSILQSLHNTIDGIPGMKLVEVPWADWSSFRKIIRTMDLSLHCSFSETFCITAADAVAEGTPTVGSSAIEWLPEFACADPDTPEDIASVGIHMLHDPIANEKVHHALRNYLDNGAKIWTDYLNGAPQQKQRSGKTM